eukprot:2672612-Pyramimonas_sp.AAC.1
MRDGIPHLPQPSARLNCARLWRRRRAGSASSILYAIGREAGLKRAVLVGTVPFPFRRVAAYKI